MAFAEQLGSSWHLLLNLTPCALRKEQFEPWICYASPSLHPKQLGHEDTRVDNELHQRWERR